jgi:hypothetical protein
MRLWNKPKRVVVVFVQNHPHPQQEKRSKLLFVRLTFLHQFNDQKAVDNQDLSSTQHTDSGSKRH